MSKLIIDTPWGKIEADKDGGILTRKMIQVALTQLTDFQIQGNNTQHLKDDISGYQKLLEHKNSDELCDAFIKVKHAARNSGKRFENNLEVLKAMGME